MRVYLAAPLFTDAERDFNLALATRLEAAGCTVFLPQRDSPQDDAGPGYPARIFATDVRGLEQAEVVVAVCDGIPMDDGTAWEIGYARARGTPVVGVRTDRRIVGPEERVNLMIQESVRAMVSSIDDVVPMLRGAAGSASRATSNDPRKVATREPAEEARRAIVTATVGGLGALAFVPLAGIIKQFIDASPHRPWETHTLVFLVAVCFLTQLAFFFGIQTYLRRHLAVSYGWWLFDFGATIVTLALLVFLGTTATPSAKQWFIVTLGILYLCQGMWAAIHLTVKGSEKHLVLGCVMVGMACVFAVLVLLTDRGPLPTFVGAVSVVLSLIAAANWTARSNLPGVWTVGDPLLGVVILIVYAWDRGLVALASFWIIAVCYSARLAWEAGTLVRDE